MRFHQFPCSDMNPRVKNHSKSPDRFIEQFEDSIPSSKFTRCSDFDTGCSHWLSVDESTHSKFLKKLNRKNVCPTGWSKLRTPRLFPFVCVFTGSWFSPFWPVAVLFQEDAYLRVLSGLDLPQPVVVVTSDRPPTSD